MDTLGIDVGGVIIDRINDNTDTSFFGDNYLETTAVPNAFETIRELVDNKFGKNVWIVSKCGLRIQQRTLRWLEHHRFYERTGIANDHVRFCPGRRDKAPICRELGVTHFIDDRLEVLVEMADVVAHRFLFDPRPDEVDRFRHRLTTEQTVRGWNEITQRILS